MPSISVRSLYQDNQHKLQLAWAAGAAGDVAADVAAGMAARSVNGRRRRSARGGKAFGQRLRDVRCGGAAAGAGVFAAPEE